MKHILVTGCHDCDKKEVDKGYTTQNTIIWFCRVIESRSINKYVNEKTIHPDCLLDDYAENKET